MADEDKMDEDASSQFGDLANFSNLHVGGGNIDDDCSVKSDVTSESAEGTNRPTAYWLCPNRFNNITQADNSNTTTQPQPSSTTATPKQHANQQQETAVTDNTPNDITQIAQVNNNTPASQVINNNNNNTQNTVSAHRATQLFDNAPSTALMEKEARLQLEVELLVRKQNKKYLSAIESNKVELERYSKVVKTQQDLLEKSEKRDNKSAELIKSYHKDLLDSSELVGRLLQEIERHEKISETLKEALDEKNDAISVKCLEISSLREQCDELIAFRTNNEANIEDAKSELSKFAAKILCLQEGFTSLTSEKEADAKRLRAELEEAKRKDSFYRRKLDFLENSKKMAEARTKSLEAEIVSKEDEVKETSYNIDELEEAAAVNKAHIEYLVADLSVKDATIQRLEVEATQMSEDMESLKEELSKEKIINQSQRMELDQLLRIDDYEDALSVATGRSINTSMSVDTRMSVDTGTSGEDDKLEMDENERKPSRGRSRHKSTSPTRRAQSYAPDPESRKGLPPAPESRRARSRSSARTKTTYKLRVGSGNAETDVVISEALAFTIFDARVVFETEAGDYLPKVSTSLLGLARKFAHYRSLILGSDTNKEKVNHFLHATEEMTSLLGDRPPTVTEIHIVYKLLSISLTTRDDYNNGENGCKVPVESFLCSLKQVTPKTLHFIIVLMLCPKDKFNAEGLFCDPNNGSEDCDTLQVLGVISDLMVESSVEHVSGNNFEVFNGTRSNCIRVSKRSKKGKKFTHCAKCSDDEAARRGGLLNSFGAFLRFCGVPTLLISFAGDGILKLKDEINPDLFSHYAGLHSTHACNFLNFIPKLKTVKKHLASVYERTLPSCNMYESFLRDVSDRADKLGLSFPMPDTPLIDHMADSEQLPFFGNRFNSVQLKLAKDSFTNVYVARYGPKKVIIFYSPDGCEILKDMIRLKGGTFNAGSFPTITELRKGKVIKIAALTIEMYVFSSKEAAALRDMNMEPGAQKGPEYLKWFEGTKKYQRAQLAQAKSTDGAKAWKSSEEFWRAYFASQVGDTTAYKYHTGSYKGKPNTMAMVGGVAGVTRIDAIFLPYQADYDKAVKEGFIMEGSQQGALKKIARNINNLKSTTFKNKTIAACPEKCDDSKRDNCEWVGKSITDLESFEMYVKHGAKFSREASAGNNKYGRYGKGNDDNTPTESRSSGGNTVNNAPAEEMEEDTGNGGEEDGESEESEIDNGGEGLPFEGRRRRYTRRNIAAQQAANPELRDMRVNDEEEDDSEEDVSDTGAMSEDEDDVEYDESADES